MDLHFIVHGVPKGQNIWGADALDRAYIETFYGRQANQEKLLIVEVRQAQATAYCYYTFLVTGAINDVDGRAGGYFALTLRFDHYYADVQNMYNLLQAAYHKFIVGSILQQGQGFVQHTVSTYGQQEARLKALEEQLKNYIVQFSTDADLIPLKGFAANSAKTPALIHLLEGSASSIAAHVQKEGGIAISPFAPTQQERRVIAEADAKIKAMRQEHEQTASTIQMLNAQLKEQQGTTAQLDAEKKKLSLQLQEAQTRLTTCADAIKQAYSAVATAAGAGRPKGTATPKPSPQGEGHRVQPQPSVSNRLLSFILLGITTLLLLMMGWMLFQSHNHGRAIEQLSATLTVKPDTSSTTLPTAATSPLSSAPTAPSAPVSPAQSSASAFAQAEISIEGYSAQHPMSASKPKVYPLRLHNAPDHAGGSWKASSGEIKDGKFIPRQAGACTISYIVDNQTVATRTIEVKE